MVDTNALRDFWVNAVILVGQNITDCCDEIDALRAQVADLKRRLQNVHETGNESESD